jgi:hypothetical protein
VLRTPAFLLFTAICLLTAIRAPAAGVTLITHGQQFGGGNPGWLDDMASAIAARNGPATTIIHVEVDVVNGSLGIAQLVVQSGTLPTPSSTNAEVILKLFWGNVAGGSYSATEIANQAVPLLLLPIDWGGGVVTSPFAEMPVHLVGHSRGASVIAQISKQLAAQGIWVDQLTTLDPFPVSLFGDPAVSIFDNVIFSDSCRQGLSFPEGVSLTGTTTQVLDSRFMADMIPDVTPTDHTQVHEWYHGLIDTNATSVDGDPIPRSVWYVPGDVGYQYSRLAGGTYTGGTRATNNTGLRFAGAPRTAVTRTATGSNLWDNLAIANLATNTTVIQGASFNAEVYFEDVNHDASLQLGLDTDDNPYNGVAGIPLFKTNTSALPGTFASVSLGTAGVSPGIYRVYGRITNTNRSRWFVPIGRVTVLQNTGPVLQPPVRSGNGTVLLNLTGQIGGTYVIETSTNLTSWTPLATNVLSANPWVYPDTPPANPPQRYYRAFLRP